MDKIMVEGGVPLFGTLPISGAKNASLPLLISSLLTSEPVTFHNVPRLADIQLLLRLLRNCGVDVTIHGKRIGQDAFCGDTVTLTSRMIVDSMAPYELVSKMRASFWVLAPLLVRCGEAKVSLPGGCAIGTRPVDLHMMALEKLGAEISLEKGYVCAKTPRGLSGALISFPKVSVGATHTALMASVCAHGETVIENAACEPEVSDLAECLVKMGAHISGIGSPELRVRGVTTLSGTEHNVIPDRIEAGTYAIAVAMAGGDVLLKGLRESHLIKVFEILKQVGVSVSTEDLGVRITRNGGGLKPISIETEPYPGFPTDLQAQFMALMTRANGTSLIKETIFENRFMHVQELARFGAKIALQGDTAKVEGVPLLRGAPVMATDLRASVSLVIAALAAEGQTTIHRVYHLDRGFESLEAKLSACGAKISRLKDGEE